MRTSVSIKTSCCFTGHRAEKLPCSLDYLAGLLDTAIGDAVEKGYGTFYHGACTGVDLIAAERVLLRKRSMRAAERSAIRLVGVLPFEGQANHWDEHWRERYFNVLEQCDDVVTLHPRFVRGCYQQRNRYMLDRSNLLIAAYAGQPGGTKNTVAYAHKLGREIVHIPI